MQTLFHISEHPRIERFEPRMPPSEHAEITWPVVWAVDESHLANYLLPRDCPRVAYRHLADSLERDRERFFGASDATHVVVIESRWLERATECTLWLYGFSPQTFVCADATAGYFVSSVAVTPSSVRCVEQPLVELAAAGVELRVMDSLRDLADAIVSSSLAFSCIRMRNAGA